MPSLFTRKSSDGRFNAVQSEAHLIEQPNHRRIELSLGKQVCTLGQAVKGRHPQNNVFSRREFPIFLGAKGYFGIQHCRFCTSMC
jgi:hypothetical protein